MKNLINNIAWTGLLIMLCIAMSTSSCKKDDPKPITKSIQSSIIITKYYSSSPVNCEKDTITVFNRNEVITISSPVRFYDNSQNKPDNSEFPYPSGTKDYVYYPLRLNYNAYLSNNKLSISMVVLNKANGLTPDCQYKTVIYNKI